MCKSNKLPANGLSQLELQALRHFSQRLNIIFLQGSVSIGHAECSPKTEVRAEKSLMPGPAREPAPDDSFDGLIETMKALAAVTLQRAPQEAEYNSASQKDVRRAIASCKIP